ncbi:uncharacterized protein [Euphorbia lathyris]|uniref:uncharacterized protein n=1 Tax=Euphorbia lathyris TaxID=212925 RepID=UPI003314496D
MSSSYGVITPFPLLLILLISLSPFVVISYSDSSTTTPQVNGSLTSNEILSLMEPEKVVEMRLILNESKRKLNGFQICALCTCCGGAKGVCLPSPCCYAINCNIPNRPFGFCSFTPKTCNCFGCHI